MRFKVMATAALAALALAAVGGGSASSTTAAAGPCAQGAQSVSVNVGNGKPIKVPCKGIKVGYFAFATTNQWLQVLLKVTKQRAAKYGWTLKVYDAVFDPTRQLDEIQNAIQRDHLNGAVILPTSGKLLCKAVSKDMPGAGIVTVAQTVPICGNEVKAAGNSAVPGILSFVGNQDNVPFNAAWLKAAAKNNPGPQNVALVMGPQIVEQAIAINKATSVLKSFPNFKIKHKIYTDYTTGTSLSKTRALLKSDPNISLIMSAYSPDQTTGVLQALREVGKLGKISVIDIGATKWTYQQMRKGYIQMTVPLMPYFTAGYAMDALEKAFDGQKVPRGIIDLTTSEFNPLIITRKNMSKYTPQY
jgi:ribose transport system substrate-binding protein